MDKIEKMINAFKTKTVDSAIIGFTIEHNDNITNKVRKYLDSLSKEELISIQNYLKNLLNYCYNGTLFPAEIDQEDQNKINNLSKNEKFLLKESIIYFYGRLLISSDISILQKAYELDEDKYIKLNITFSSLGTFNEEIELDFVDKVLSSAEYDQMIRSWTMAYFKSVPNPYEYVDKETDDWTPAKLPRLERLSIDDESNPKFKKAIAFRLLDLVVIYLFINSRKENILSDSEKAIIKNARIDYDVYSETKKEKLAEVKKLILTK